MGRKSVEESIKWQAIELWRAGKSYCNIGSALGISKTCVEHLVEKYKASGIVIDVSYSGRPRKTSHGDRCIVKKFKKNGMQF